MEKRRLFFFHYKNLENEGMKKIEGNQKLRDEMMFFHGQLSSLQFIAISSSCSNSNGLNDLLENMQGQYESFLQQIWAYKDE